MWETHLEVPSNRQVLNGRRYGKVVLIQMVHEAHPIMKMKTDHNRQVLLLEKAATHKVHAVLVPRLEVPAESLTGQPVPEHDLLPSATSRSRRDLCGILKVEIM